MLRITTSVVGSSVIARLEGRLLGPWVEELARWWATETQADKHRPLEVDLSDVSFVDPSGRLLLERMCRAGVSLRASGCMTRAILEEILACARRGDGAAGRGATPEEGP